MTVQYHLLLCLFLSLCLAWLPIALSSSWRIPATEVKYRFSENSPPGQILGNVAGSAPQKSVTYAFGAPSQLFHLDPVTSELSLKAEIDAEKLCGLATWRDDEKGDPNNDLTDIVTCTPSTGELSVQLDVNAILPDGGLQAVFKVTVEVLDVDDNPPLFDNQRVWKRHLREVFYRKGRKIDLPKARDIDLLPEHRLIRYTLEQHSPAVEDTFHFEVSSSETPTLVLLKDLDAETQEYFNMTLVAFNPSRSSHYHGMYVGGRGSEQLESRLQVEIYVVDMNDNEPYFEEPSCNVTVHEDTLPGTVIFQLKAHDEDRNAQLDYSLVEASGGGQQAVASIFEVEKGGRVILRRGLDFESCQNYILPVSVTDGDFSAETTLHVTVADVNDEAPRFEINPIHLTAEEGTSAKRSIGQVRVYDPDSVEVNGVVRCKEPEEWVHRQVLLFTPDPQAHPSAGLYDLQTRLELDREGPDTLAGGVALVRFICWDANEVIHTPSATSTFGGAVRRLTSTLTATLTIRDVNDNPPTFYQPVYHVAVAENNHIGTKIIQVQAHDPDDGENAEITYSLLDRANFHVDPVSGWVTAAIEFDREKRDSYQVTIIASDNGSQRLTGSALLNVTILDQNDNPPHLLPCDKVPTPLVVWENSPIGTFVGDLIASDADIGRNGELVFRLPKKLAFTSHFELRPNGSLFTALPLDREQKHPSSLHPQAGISVPSSHQSGLYPNLQHEATYELPVEVRDRGSPNALSSTETICIKVLDENDNDPHFVLPDRLYSLEDQLPDTPSAYLRKRESTEMASDASEGATKFAKGASVAAEMGGGRGDAEAADNGGGYEPSLRISLHEMNGQLITRLEATDPDEDANGRVVYGLRRHTHSRARLNRAAGDFLGVNGNTGEIWLKRTLQEDDLGPHFFVVSANDQGTSMSRSESKVLLVSVEDIPPRSLDVGGASSSFIASSEGGDGEGGVLANLFPFKLGERKNVLILVGLISVSVILAVILVAAMICMLKPCRSSSRQTHRFFNQHRMSQDGTVNVATMQAHTAANGGIISLQETRLIDNTSVDNYGSGIGVGNHDYGYGPPVSPVDVGEPDGWVGSDGKGGIFRVVNADADSSVNEEATNRVPQMWNKYNSLPRDRFERCGSPLSLNQENLCSTTSTAGMLMTPLREIGEIPPAVRSPNHWAAATLSRETNFQSNSTSHIALPVTLLPAVCLHSSGTNVVTASNPFAPTTIVSVNSTTTTFQPTMGKKAEMEIRLAEHASDSGRGASDEDLRFQSQPPPVINLVQLPCEFSEEDPWKRTVGGEAPCSDDFVRLRTSTIHPSLSKHSTDALETQNCLHFSVAAIPGQVNIVHRRLPAC
ncbi:Protocadherin gamma-A4 [Echinococcus granulosus]|uniref:Cadherin n=1 Tax=Echinococcus granulosus TaxID=6210 RepID=A0A068WT52_ECHGR|nr:Protocadherin gamma-A4 [Echinococcus granulosus]CDS21677.1 cadherin [Echinococcus granulosus]